MTTVEKNLQNIIETKARSELACYSKFSPAYVRKKFNQEMLEKQKQLPKIALCDISNLSFTYQGTKVQLRKYTPSPYQKLPALMYFHGGGFVIRDDMDVYDHTCRLIAKETGVAIIAVNYRLAPEFPFPAALEDCYAATKWCIDNADELQIDSSKVGVWGESCGGNLAVTVPLLSIEKKEFKLNWSVAISSMLDLSFSTGSYQDFSDGYILKKTTLQWFWDKYLSRSEDYKNPLVVPALHPKKHLLPPTYIVTTYYDPLRDEGEHFSRMLNEAGVLYKYTCFEGLTHGFFDMYYDVRAARLACDQIFKTTKSLVSTVSPL